jgi:hypothetical protein
MAVAALMAAVVGGIVQTIPPVHNVSIKEVETLCD